MGGELKVEKGTWIPTTGSLPAEQKAAPPSGEQGQCGWGPGNPGEGEMLSGLGREGLTVPWRGLPLGTVKKESDMM